MVVMGGIVQRIYRSCNVVGLMYMVVMVMVIMMVMIVVMLVFHQHMDNPLRGVPNLDTQPV